MTKEMKAKLEPHQELLSAEEYEMCLNASRDITEHPDLREAMTAGANEVSFFWRDPTTGVPCKGRADRVKARCIWDLKSIANRDDYPIETVAGLNMKKYRYDIQAVHYLTGLALALKTGQVFNGGTAAHRALIEQVKTSIMNDDFSYIIIFLEKSEYAEVWGAQLSPENNMLSEADDVRRAAIEKYKAMFEHHGLERWPQTWRLREWHKEDIGDRGWH